MKATQTHPSYYDIDRACSVIVHQILGVKQTPPNVIVGLTRGGLIPAVIISHMLGQFDLDVKMVPISYSSKVGQGEHKAYSNVLHPLPGVNVLIVDDICDSGSTLSEVEAFYTRNGYIVRTAVLHHKLGSSFQPDYIWKQIPADSCWIEYPWEV